MNESNPPLVSDLLEQNERAKFAWYSARGCVEATDSFDRILTEIYADSPDTCAARRLANFERMMVTIRELIAEHAP